MSVLLFFYNMHDACAETAFLVVMGLWKLADPLLPYFIGCICSGLRFFKFRENW